jgi:IstB-like ATP binding protein
LSGITGRRVRLSDDCLSRYGHSSCPTRSNRKSTLITSNRSIGEWGMVFGDAVVGTAILDRLLHHSHVITIRGDSYRLREKRRTGLLKAPAIASSVPEPRHD